MCIPNAIQAELRETPDYLHHKPLDVPPCNCRKPGEHSIGRLATSSRYKLPVCTAGRGAGPGEEDGGALAYMQRLDQEGEDRPVAAADQRWNIQHGAADAQDGAGEFGCQEPVSAASGRACG